MKTYKAFFGAIVALLLLASCDHDVSMQTTVYDDGSLDKTITLEGDSAQISNNFVGVSTASGWQLQILSKDSVPARDKKELILKFTKHFKSAEEASQELAAPNDTLFRVTSRFDRKFRWFYTYLYYSDTYHAINRLSLPSEDYFTSEDFAFIDRLPAEGSPISKADSLYLDRLNEKIFDFYGSRALFESYYTNLEALLNEENKTMWIDTLKKYKETMYTSLMDEKDGDLKFLEIDGMPKLPLSETQLGKLEDDMETSVDFFSLATSGKYKHTITLPGKIVNTNADSVTGNSLHWRPSATKFILKDYSLYGESRKLNLWAVLVSLSLIIGSVFITFYKRR